MKAIKKIKTPTGGEFVIYKDSIGNLTSAKPIDEVQTYKQFVVTDDPSQYALGTGMDTFEQAKDLRNELNELKAVDQALYIIELHYAQKDDQSPPIAVFVYDENLKRTRII